LSVFLVLTAFLAPGCDEGSSTSTAGSGGTTATTGTAGNGGATTGTAGSGGATTGTAGSGGTSSSGSGASGGAGGTAGNGGTTSTGGTGGIAGNGGTGGIAGNGGTGGNAGNGGMAGAGGNTGGSSSTGTGPVGNWAPPPMVVVPALPPPPDYSNHPVDPQGRPIVAAGPLVNWVVPSVKDPISARELCADLVANCFEPGVRSLDACFMSAPHCTTSQPWTEPAACCADPCFTAYSAERIAGVDPLTAYLRVLYEGPICMPGVDALLGGAP